jgi:hypothetical protein
MAAEFNNIGFPGFTRWSVAERPDTLRLVQRLASPVIRGSTATAFEFTAQQNQLHLAILQASCFVVN